MKRALLILLTACGSDVFVSIPSEDASPNEATAPDVVNGSDAAIDVQADDVREASAVDTGADSGIDAPAPVCDPGDVAYGGKCFYLDGTGGFCAQGYAVSSDSALGAVLSNNANAFTGKNYRTKVSVNCCVYTQDAVRNFGMVSHCNVIGPFGAGEPKFGGNGCVNQSAVVKQDQITLCERSL